MPAHDVSDRRQYAIGLTAAMVIGDVVQQIVDIATAYFEKLTIPPFRIAYFSSWRLISP
jgi:hypothetical protein